MKAKAMVHASGLALVVVAAVIGLGLALSATGTPAGKSAQAQDGLAAPANVRAVEGVNPGAVVVSWDAVDGAAFYRIGWVAFDDIAAVQAAGRDWLDAFDFKDVENKGQTAQALKGLTPGVRYAFIVASVPYRFGNAQHWSDWTYLTTASAPMPTPAPAGTPCPAGPGTVPDAPEGGTPTPTPVPGATGTATPTPVPGATGTATPTPAPGATGAATPTPVPGATATATPTPAPGATVTVTPTPVPGATATVTPTPTITPTPVVAPTPTASGKVDYDTDDDGLIEISSLAQLDVIRHDLDGDGVSSYADYAAAFPNAMVAMGCLERCAGYELAANLDFDTNGSGGGDAGDAYWNDGAGWLPIGDPDSETDLRFNTIFDGGGHTIANLYIRRTDADYIGLFRAIGSDAVIRNLGLTGLDVAGGADRVGGLAGASDGVIINSYTAGRVSGGGRIGGLVGHNSGSISGSHSSAWVTGGGYRVGGLVGASSGSIADSYAIGDVVGRGAYTGGLAGVIDWDSGGKGSINRSYATGNVTGDGNYVGGLVGYNNGDITDSHAAGPATGEGSYVGGLAGYSNGVITASYAAGVVTGASSSVGGLVGRSNGVISGSYATGSAIGGGSAVGGLAGYGGPDSSITASYAAGVVIGESSQVGGLVGDSNGAIIAGYATGSVTGNDNVGGLVGSGDYRSRISTSYAIGSVTGDDDVGGLVGSGYRVRRTDSYWDTQTTGQSRSGSGAGRTTRELQAPTAAIGIYANWNADWWDFGTSQQYPVLKYGGLDAAAQRP